MVYLHCLTSVSCTGNYESSTGHISTKEEGSNVNNWYLQGQPSCISNVKAGQIKTAHKINTSLIALLGFNCSILLLCLKFLVLLSSTVD